MSTLFHLTALAELAYFAQAARFEAEARAGVWKICSGEPVADLNYLFVSRGSADSLAALREMVADLDRRFIPFVCMVAPDVAPRLEATCREAGLVHVADWPLMVCPASSVVAHEKEGIVVHPVETEADARDAAAALSGAFRVALDSTLRAVPFETACVPGIEIYLARVDGKAVSTVSTTRHDRIVGIWAMATLPEHQGKGAGKVLLSQVMERHRRRGAESFFLGATAAGFPLYEKLGYRTVAIAPVWVRGETHQA